MYNYEYECMPCGEFVFEETRQLADRNRLATCPKCGHKECKKIMSRTQFNEIFPGSTKQESLAEYWTQESVRAQAEGFRSKGELETAIGQAKDRAKAMGQPDKQLVGPVKSPYEGPKYNPTTDEVSSAGALVKQKIRATHSGNEREVRKASEALKEHETAIREKAKSTQKFVPKNSKDDLRKAIMQAQSQRGGSLH